MTKLSTTFLEDDAYTCQKPAVRNGVGPTPVPITITPSPCDALNQITAVGNTTLAYDANGNLTTDEQGHTQVYDAWNRLLAVEGTDGSMLAVYAYDAAGRRITESAPNQNPREIYFSGQQVVQEDINASGLKLAAQYYWSPVYQNALILRDYDFRLNHTFNLNERVYALQDANYNVTALVTHFTLVGDITGDGHDDSLDLAVMMSNYNKHVAGGDAVGDLDHNGMVNSLDLPRLLANYNHTTSNNQWLVTERLVYNAYGAFTTTVRDARGNWQNWGDCLAWNITFQGGRWNALTRQVQFGVRQVDVDTGRWTSAEPSLGAYVDGLNLYQAFAANPINRVDSSGLAAKRNAYVQVTVGTPYDAPQIREIDQKLIDLYGDTKKMAMIYGVLRIGAQGAAYTPEAMSEALNKAIGFAYDVNGRPSVNLADLASDIKAAYGQAHGPWHVSTRVVYEELEDKCWASQVWEWARRGDKGEYKYWKTKTTDWVAYGGNPKAPGDDGTFVAAWDAWAAAKDIEDAALDAWTTANAKDLIP